MIQQIEIILQRMKKRFLIDKKLLLLYGIVFLATGLLMDATGRMLEIARFQSRWQIISCYIIYLIPVALYIRHLSFFNQYLYSLFFLALLEFPAYALGTSIAYSNNLISRVFQTENFSLFMVVFFSAYLPLANKTIAKIYYRFFR